MGASVALVALIGVALALVRVRRRQSGEGALATHAFPLWNPTPTKGKGRGKGAGTGGKDDMDQALLGRATGLGEEEAQQWLVDLEQLEIFEEIGGGASAQVYRGAYFGQTVAVKRLYGCLGQALETQEKFFAFFGNEIERFVI